MPVGRSVAKVATALGAYVSLAALISLALFPVRATGRADTIGRAQIFRGLDRPGLAAKDNENFGVPPDPTGAIGRRHYLEAVNSRLALFDASGLKQLRARDAYAFWGKSNTGQVVDPQVVWDDGARRWYYAALFNGGGDNDNEILLAWSKSGDPANLEGGWCRMSISTGKLFDDFPKLGFSRNHILIGTNVADLGERRILFGRLWAIGKPAKGDASCTRPPIASFGSESSPLRQADGRPAFTLVPVNPVRPAGSAYVIAADCIDDSAGEPLCGQLDRRGRQITVWHVDGPPASPQLTRDGGIDVRSYKLPVPAPQPGAKTTLDTSDTRLTQAVSAPDPTLRVSEAIWTQHTVDGPGGRSVVRWYELDPRRLSILRQGTIANRRNWVFNAAISPTSRGDGAVIDYNVAGGKQLPEIRARTRGPKDAKSAMKGEVTLAKSVSPDTCDLDPGEPCPWGDYAAATPDPRRANVVWGSNELLGSPKHPGPLGSHWRTQNFAIRAG